MLTDSLHNSRTASMLVPITGHNPIKILPLSSKIKMNQKSMKTVPKITVNSCNLQRAHRGGRSQSPIRKKISNDLDDDLGNILDIPIIFAKDGENLNAIEKSPSISQMPVAIESYDKNSIPKLSGTTKVVLISNKNDRLQQPISSSANTPIQALVRASGPQNHVSRAVLHTRAQNLSIANTNRTNTPIQAVPRLNQTTIKYTKIILAKRNSIINKEDKNEQVILTKNTSKMITYDKNEHRYAQILPKQQIKFQEIIQDDALEIEDAIKTNIIERKIQTVSEADLTLPSKNGHSMEPSMEPLNNLDSIMEMKPVKTDDLLPGPNILTDETE